MEPRVSVITLGTTDVDRARSFYEAMGWTATSPDGEVVFMQALGMVLALWSRELLAEDSGVTDAGGWGGVTLAQNVLDQARAAGARIARDGAPTSWGGYAGVFVDPDGHPWEVAHNPHWRLADDGSVHLP
jgi:uncharacterized protein